MQDSQKDHGKYAEFRIHDYLGDLKFGVVLLKVVCIWAHFSSNIFRN